MAQQPGSLGESYTHYIVLNCIIIMGLLINRNNNYYYNLICSSDMTKNSFNISIVNIAMNIIIFFEFWYTYPIQASRFQFPLWYAFHLNWDVQKVSIKSQMAAISLSPVCEYCYHAFGTKFQYLCKRIQDEVGKQFR